MTARHEIWELLDGLQMDLRAANAKLVALRSYAANLSLEDKRPSCPHCGYRAAMNLPSVAEHIETAHPEHVEPSRAQASQETPENGGRAG